MFGAYGFYGDFGAYGFYGAASDSYRGQIESQKKKIADLRKKVWKEVVFSYGRKQAELAVQKAVVDLRSLESKYRKAKRDEAKYKRDAAKKTKTKAPAAPAASGALTAAQTAAIQALIQQMTAAGTDADAAEEAAKLRILPPQLIRAIPRGFFRGVRRAGPRPAPPAQPSLPQFSPPSYAPMPGELPGPTRSLDPRIHTRPIDPRIFTRSIDPDPRVRGLDPSGNNMPLLPGLGPQAGSFTFAPGNIADAEEMEEMEGGLDGIVDTVKAYAAKPWVMGLALLGAVLYGPKLLRSLKGGAKKNPRRNRKAKANRRSRRSRRNRR